jgi:hypothetical protein
MPASKKERILAVHRAAERDAAFFAEHPELLEPYRGQWVVAHEGRVIAHSPDGAGLAERAPAHKYPGSSIFYLPTREELEGVFIT